MNLFEGLGTNFSMLAVCFGGDNEGSSNYNFTFLHSGSVGMMLNSTLEVEINSTDLMLNIAACCISFHFYEFKALFRRKISSIDFLSWRQIATWISLIDIKEGSGVMNSAQGCLEWQVKDKLNTQFSKFRSTSTQKFTGDIVITFAHFRSIMQINFLPLIPCRFSYGYHHVMNALVNVLRVGQYDLVSEISIICCDV